jgi:metal-responsive CopG/Arc/MetJ family transcriptional regulator
MSNVKTAISMQESLFKRVDDASRKMRVSRSRVFVLAVEEYFQRLDNRQLLEAIDAAYDDNAQKEDVKLSHKIRRHQKRQVAEQW